MLLARCRCCFALACESVTARQTAYRQRGVSMTTTAAASGRSNRVFPSDDASPVTGITGGSDNKKKKDEPKEPKQAGKRKRLTVAARNAVWNQWIGIELGLGACHCCGRQVYQQDFECGHVVAASRGGSDAPDNLRPLCRACNRSMRDRNLYEFRSTVLGRPKDGGEGRRGDPMDVDD